MVNREQAYRRQRESIKCLLLLWTLAAFYARARLASRLCLHGCPNQTFEQRGKNAMTAGRGQRGIALTTIRQPTRQLGVVAATTLLEQLGGDDGTDSPALLDVELVQRASTARFSGSK